ncbi:hypothetical protein [Deinococcus yavapaiensis]|uniref:hypothetical protein n=1 Tax=Deinococcus yavapaiensis TaxID=309889 RepID=UPI000DA13E73|nr:hypothetical protein [Deinococcus yavapaiensis]
MKQVLPGEIPASQHVLTATSAVVSASELRSSVERLLTLPQDAKVVLRTPEREVLWIVQPQARRRLSLYDDAVSDEMLAMLFMENGAPPEEAVKVVAPQGTFYVPDVKAGLTLLLEAADREGSRSEDVGR